MPGAFFMLQSSDVKCGFRWTHSEVIFQLYSNIHPSTVSPAARGFHEEKIISHLRSQRRWLVDFEQTSVVAMKFFLLCVWMLLTSISIASDHSPRKDVSVKIQKLGNGFEVEVSYFTHMDLCNSFAFLTDYEDARNIPGIVESNILSRSGNKVVVERKASETILLFPLEISSTIEYTEIPYLGLNFEQIRGDSKIYRGTWRLEPKDGSTKLTYLSVIELDSVVPQMVQQYFVKNSIQKRFEFMASRARLKEQKNSSKCPWKYFKL